jgi:hypothetical protein
MRLRLAHLCELNDPEIFGPGRISNMEQSGYSEKQPRRKFLTRFFSAVAGATTVLLLPRKGRAAEKGAALPEAGPILYRRTEEAERYYRTLYR